MCSGWTAGAGVRAHRTHPYSSKVRCSSAMALDILPRSTVSWMASILCLSCSQDTTSMLPAEVPGVMAATPAMLTVTESHRGLKRCDHTAHSSNGCVLQLVQLVCCKQNNACRRSHGLGFFFQLFLRRPMNQQVHTTTRCRHGMCTAMLSTGQALRIRA